MAKQQKRKSAQNIRKSQEPEKQPALKDIPGKTSFPFNNFLVICLIIALACVGIYYRTLSYGFTYHDDNVIVLDNLPFLKDASNIPDAIVMDAWFRHQQIELYRPLQNVSFIIDAQIGEDIIFSTHLTNLMLHILCCIAVFYLLTLLRFERKYALLGALIYAVHFLFLHAVIWVPARGDLLLSLFSFLSMITFLLIIRSDKWYFYVFNILVFTLALFAKETAIMLPVIFVVYLFLFYRKKTFTKGNAILAVSYLVVIIVFYLLRNMSIAKDEQQIGLKGLFLNLQTIPETVLKLFVPVNFCTMPAFNTVASLLGSLIIIGLIILFLVKKQLFSKHILFSLIWFAFFLLPGMAYRPNFASHTYEYLDHRAYLPSLGVLMMFLCLIQDFEYRSKNVYVGKIIMIFSVLFLIYLGVMNFRLNGIYKNAITYSESAFTGNTHSSLAYFIHAREMEKAQNKDRALEDYNNAVKYYPKFFDARFNRALLLYEKKEYKESLGDLDFIINSEPGFGFNVYGLRGIVRSATGDYEGAESDLRAALKMNPEYSDGLKNLEILQTIKKNQPVPPQSRIEAGRLNTEGVELAKKGNYKEAIKLFEKSYAKDSTSYESIYNIGNCMHAMGDVTGACEKWKFAADHGNQGAQAMFDKICK